MAEQFANNYAILDENNMCIDVRSTSENCDDNPNFIIISEANPNYLFKYYNVADGKWYEDAAFTIEWSPA